MLPEIAGEDSVISVALIDDNRLAREGISALLNQLPDIQVVIGASSADTENSLCALHRESFP